MNKLKRKYMILRRKLVFYGSARMVADNNGRPRGSVWFTICTGLGNFKLFPVGYVNGRQARIRK